MGLKSGKKIADGRGEKRVEDIGRGCELGAEVVVPRRWSISTGDVHEYGWIGAGDGVEPRFRIGVVLGSE